MTYGTELRGRAWTIAGSLATLALVAVGPTAAQQAQPRQESGIAPEMAFVVGVVVGALAAYALIQYRENERAGAPTAGGHRQGRGRQGAGQQSAARRPPADSQRTPGAGTRQGQQSGDPRGSRASREPQGSPGAEREGTNAGDRRRPRRSDDR